MIYELKLNITEVEDLIDAPSGGTLTNPCTILPPELADLSSDLDASSTDTFFFIVTGVTEVWNYNFTWESENNCTISNISTDIPGAQVSLSGVGTSSATLSFSSGPAWPYGDPFGSGAEEYNITITSNQQTCDCDDSGWSNWTYTNGCWTDTGSGNGVWDEGFDSSADQSLSDCMLSYQSSWESGIDSTYYCNGNNTTHSCGVNYQLWRNNRTVSTSCNESNPTNCECGTCNDYTEYDYVCIPCVIEGCIDPTACDYVCKSGMPFAGDTNYCPNGVGSAPSDLVVAGDCVNIIPESNTGENCGCSSGGAGFDAVVPNVDSAIGTTCCDTPVECCADSNENGYCDGDPYFESLTFCDTNSVDVGGSLELDGFGCPTEFDSGTGLKKWILTTTQLDQCLQDIDCSDANHLCISGNCVCMDPFTDFLTPFLETNFTDDSTGTYYANLDQWLLLRYGPSGSVTTDGLISLIPNTLETYGYLDDMEFLDNFFTSTVPAGNIYHNEVYGQCYVSDNGIIDYTTFIGESTIPEECCSLQYPGEMEDYNTVVDGGTTDYWILNPDPQTFCDYGVLFDISFAGNEMEAFDYVEEPTNPSNPFTQWWKTATAQYCGTEGDQLFDNQGLSWRFTICCPNGILSNSTRECVDDPGGEVDIVLVQNPVDGITYFANYGQACASVGSTKEEHIGYECINHTGSDLLGGEFDGWLRERIDVGEYILDDVVGDLGGLLNPTGDYLSKTWAEEYYNINYEQDNLGWLQNQWDSGELDVWIEDAWGTYAPDGYPLIITTAKEFFDKNYCMVGGLHLLTEQTFTESDLGCTGLETDNMEFLNAFYRTNTSLYDYSSITSYADLDEWLVGEYAGEPQQCTAQQAADGEHPCTQEGLDNPLYIPNKLDGVYENFPQFQASDIYIRGGNSIPEVMDANFQWIAFNLPPNSDGSPKEYPDESIGDDRTLLEYLKDSFYDMSGELFDWTDGLLMLGFTMNAYYYLNDGEEKHSFYLSYQPSQDDVITWGGEKLISGVAYRISSPVEGYFRFEED